MLLVEIGGGRGRGPTMLADEAARELERELREAGFEARRGGGWPGFGSPNEEGWPGAVREALELARGAGAVVVALPARLLGEALDSEQLQPSAVLLRAELPRQRSLAALAVAELRARGLRAADRSAAARPGRHSPGARRNRPRRRGLATSGEARSRIARAPAAPGPAPSAGGGAPADARRRARRCRWCSAAVLALFFATLLLAAFGGAVTGKSRTQRAADLAALSAARSMRDDFDRLFVAATGPDGSPNPAHLDKREYLERAAAAGEEAAERNGVGDGRLRIEFPDAASFAPLRVRAQISAELDTPGGLPHLPVAAHAEAEAVPATTVGDRRPAVGGERRRLLRTARVPPGRGHAPRRRRRLRPNWPPRRATTGSRC